MSCNVNKAKCWHFIRDRAVFKGSFTGSTALPPPKKKIVAAPHSTAFSIPRAVLRGSKRIYVMSLVTRIVVRCSILCSKFTKNHLSAGLHLDKLGSLQHSPRHSSWIKRATLQRRREQGERGKGRKGNETKEEKGSAIPPNKNTGSGSDPRHTKLGYRVNYCVSSALPYDRLLNSEDFLAHRVVYAVAYSTFVCIVGDI